MRKKVLIFILVLLVILTACKGGADSKKTQAGGFIGTKEGLVSTMNIDSASGGNKVLDAGVESFRILVNVQNKGEHSIPENDVMVTLDGINLQAFQIKNPTQRNTIPLSAIRREAGKVTTPAQIPIVYDANYLSDEDADRTTTIGANVCYKYETISRIKNLCLRKKITGAVSATACKIDEVKLSESSAAPFQVTTFSERPAGESKVNVYIEAKNPGKGIMYDKDYLSQGKCVDSDKDRNKVYVKVELTEFKNSASLVSCSGLRGNEGYVNVIQNSMQLSCTIDTSSLQESSFETPLRVSFQYVYKDSVSTTVTIKNSNPV
ncbi:hypothetical protein HYU23_01895 [Candidatus Woesearchaeota archaeon]|nr:hypothetical protein [Candidatus Woesearchaeota archaeon]